MKDDKIYKASIIYGHVELKEFHKFENGRMIYYGYSITYDRDGNEMSRTEPTAGASIGNDDGSPFTGHDYRDLMLA